MCSYHASSLLLRFSPIFLKFLFIFIRFLALVMYMLCCEVVVNFVCVWGGGERGVRALEKAGP